MNVICSFPPQDEFPPADESVDEFPSVLKWRSKPAVASMSVSLPNLLGKSSSNLSAPDTPANPEQILEGDKTLQTVTARCWGQSPRLQLKLHAEILIQKTLKPSVPSAAAERRKRAQQNKRCSNRTQTFINPLRFPNERAQICNLGPALRHH